MALVLVRSLFVCACMYAVRQFATDIQTKYWLCRDNFCFYKVVCVMYAWTCVSDVLKVLEIHDFSPYMNTSFKRARRKKKQRIHTVTNDFTSHGQARISFWRFSELQKYVSRRSDQDCIGFTRKCER